MAIVSRQFLYIEVPDGFVNLTLTWDATSFSPEDGSPEFLGPLIEAVIRNTSLLYSVVAEIRRSNGVNVVNRTVDPNTTVRYTGGGPVKNIEDIPWSSLSVDLRL